ncbi:Uncharacterised protein [Mycobacteroides abscessus subsp. abscessus]|nr:Uncharacterised protein [Mycobacteroides abscessus subsp. abscessus]
MSVFVALQGEDGTGSELLAQVGLDIAEYLGAGGEDLAGEIGVGDHHRVSELRDVDRVDLPVFLGQPAGGPAAGRHEGNALGQLGKRHERGSDGLGDIGCPIDG